MFLEKIDAPNPYYELLAILIASSSLENFVTVKTGPKISSKNNGFSFSIVIIVGFKKFPFINLSSVILFPP